MTNYFQSNIWDRRYGILTLILLGLGLIVFLLTPPLVGNRWGQQQLSPEDLYGSSSTVRTENCELCGRRISAMGRHQTITFCCEPCGNAITALRIRPVNPQ